MAVLQHVPTRHLTTDPPLATPPEVADTATLEVFTVSVLAALTEMAARSRHCQADVAAALRRARIAVDNPQLPAALDLLQRRGLVSQVIALSDGGVLLTMTGLALERAGNHLGRG